MARKQAVTGFGRTRSAFVFAAIFSGFINVLMLTGPLFMVQVYDRVLTSKSVPTLVALSIVAAGLYGFMAILDLIRARIMVRVGMLYDQELRLPVFERMMSHAIARSPGVGTQPLRDLDTARQFVSGPAPFALFDVPWVPLYILVNYLLHPWLGYISAAGALMLLILALWSEASARRGQAQSATAALAAHGLAEEAASSADVLKSMGMTDKVKDRWSREYQVKIAQQVRSAEAASVISSLSKVTRLILQSGCLALGAYLAIHGEITAGVIIAGTTIMARALAPIDQAIGHWRSYVGYREAQQRLDRLLKSVDTEERRMTLPAPKGALAVDGLIVLAPQTGKPLISGVSFELKPGGSLGIVGPTGAGKSCLAKAIVGITPPARGTIRLDGATLDQWPAEQLGRAIGYVPQDVVLLTGTIQENIARFDPDANPELVVTAAKRANVHDMVLALPDGYNTVVGPTGIALSGGQRQRLALARALYGTPALLVLDEPNSNLDGDGEAALMAAIAEERKRGTTVVLVAHRPSALSVVEQVLVMKDGRQVEFGPRDAVVAKLRGQSGSAPAAMPRSAALSVVKEQA